MFDRKRVLCEDEETKITSSSQLSPIVVVMSLLNFLINNYISRFKLHLILFLYLTLNVTLFPNLVLRGFFLHGGSKDSVTLHTITINRIVVPLICF